MFVSHDQDDGAGAVVLERGEVVVDAGGHAVAVVGAAPPEGDGRAVVAAEVGALDEADAAGDAVGRGEAAVGERLAGDRPGTDAQFDIAAPVPARGGEALVAGVDAGGAQFVDQPVGRFVVGFPAGAVPAHGFVGADAALGGGAGGSAARCGAHRTATGRRAAAASRLATSALTAGISSRPYSRASGRGSKPRMRMVVTPRS